MKTGLCIGINYAGTEYELNGCLNDSHDWAAMLGSHGFCVTTLNEKHATKKHIVEGMTRLIGGLSDGDVGAITYSGHGTWIPDVDGDEPDGRDEAICPYDMQDDGRNLLLDNEFHAIFNGIPRGAHVLFVTDSCFSGQVYRLMMVGAAGSYRRIRFIPPAHILKRADLVHRMTLSFGQPRVIKKQPLPGLVHMSGCGDNEYSNDAEFGNRANGAMTYFALRAFDATIKQKGTYQDAWKLMRQSLPSAEFQQTPMLNALPGLKKTKLLC